MNLRRFQPLVWVRRTMSAVRVIVSPPARLVRRQAPWFGLFLLLMTTLVWAKRAQVVDARPIYRGVTYSCHPIDGQPSGGLMHLVKVDLRQPGIELYVTPRDPEAVKRGWQYRLEHTLDVVRREDLAVAANAVFFYAQGVSRIGKTRLYRTGQLARAQQTVIADGQANQNYLRGHLVWFDDELTPHLLGPRGRLDAVRDRARWAVGGEFQIVSGGRPHPNLSRRPLGQVVPRTVLGWDRPNRLLYLAVFQGAGYDEVARTLIEQDVPNAVLLDGGGSSCMVIGQHARNMRPGTVHGGLRPVAVHFGIRAEPLAE